MSHVDARVDVPRGNGGTRARLVVLGASPAPCQASLDGVALSSADATEAHAFDLRAPAAIVCARHGGRPERERAVPGTRRPRGSQRQNRRVTRVVR